MTKYVTEEFELEETTINKLKEIAEQYNATLDETINELLRDYMSTRITVEDLKEILDDIDNKDAINKFPDFYIILDSFGKPIARIAPYGENN